MFSNITKEPLNAVFAIATAVGSLAVIVSVAFAYLAIGVGLSYHPELSKIYYSVLATICLIGIAILTLLVKRSIEPPLSFRASVVAFGIGAPLAAVGIYFMLTDAGDLMVYASPTILGLCLLVLSFESQMNRGNN